MEDVDSSTSNQGQQSSKSVAKERGNESVARERERNEEPSLVDSSVVGPLCRRRREGCCCWWSFLFPL
jgi:hypothetical protein